MRKKKINNYSIYPNGWVCDQDKYLFRIDDERILRDIIDGTLTRKEIVTIIDEYPNSLYNLVKEYDRSDQDNAIDEMVKGTQERKPSN